MQYYTQLVLLTKFRMFLTLQPLYILFTIRIVSPAYLNVRDTAMCTPIFCYFLQEIWRKAQGNLPLWQLQWRYTV